MEQILYRRAQESDAERIVDFYNFVGEETSYLSFEKDEYPLDVEAQRESIRELEGNQTNIMLMAMVLQPESVWTQEQIMLKQSNSI